MGKGRTWFPSLAQRLIPFAESEMTRTLLRLLLFSPQSFHQGSLSIVDGL